MVTTEFHPPMPLLSFASQPGSRLQSPPKTNWYGCLPGEKMASYSNTMGSVSLGTMGCGVQPLRSPTIPTSAWRSARWRNVYLTSPRDKTGTFRLPCSSTSSRLPTPLSGAACNVMMSPSSANVSVAPTEGEYTTCTTDSPGISKSEAGKDNPSAPTRSGMTGPHEVAFWRWVSCWMSPHPNKAKAVTQATAFRVIRSSRFMKCP